MKSNAVFSFTVKYFGFLKPVPLLPHILDGLLKLWMVLNSSKVPVYLDDIEAEVLSWPGAKRKLHRFGGVEYTLGGKEFGHIHSNGILDILFTRKIKEELLEEGRINLHHVFPETGWISFYIEDGNDPKYAEKLLRMSYLSVQKKLKRSL